LSAGKGGTITAAMPLFNMAELRAGLERGQRLIGIDPGAKRIGVALSDVTLMLASPYAVLRRGKLRSIAAELRALASREGAGGLVVGWPLSMDGSVGPAAQAVRDWAGDLSAAAGLPAALWDERLSSVAVNEHLTEVLNLSRKKRGAWVDAAAAAYILQAALDATAG
jgi:putative holliday junction resolvase